MSLSLSWLSLIVAILSGSEFQYVIVPGEERIFAKQSLLVWMILYAIESYP